MKLTLTIRSVSPRRRVRVGTFGRVLRAATAGAALSRGTALLAQGVASPVPAPPAYPAAARGAQADELNGIRIPDPYRWLEGLAAADTKGWVTAENAVTETYLGQVARRSDVRDRVERIRTYPTLGTPFGAGERLFFFENGGFQNQPILYVQDRTGNAAGSPRVLIDPNTLSSEGVVAIVDQAPSPDGRYLAYAVSARGSAWRTVRIRDVRTGQDLGEELGSIKESPLSWTRDGRGFVYVRTDPGSPGPNSAPGFPGPDGRERLYYHRAGRPQSEDRLLFENAEHPEWRLRGEVSDDGQYLVITTRRGVEASNHVYLIDLDNPDRPNLGAPLVKLFDSGDALYEFVGNAGAEFYFRTTKNSPRARLVAVDINTPDENHWTTVLRETYDPLVEVRRVDDRLFAHRLHDGHSVLDVYSLDGGPRGNVPLPGVGTIAELHPRSEHRQLYFCFSAPLERPTVFRYDLDTRSVEPVREPGESPDSLTVRYETTLLFFTSKDGTRVPMFITARRGLTLDGKQPVLLTAGASADPNVPVTPVFSPFVAAWLDLGGIYAMANVRGGAEYGRAWREAAMGRRKRVAIDDLLAAAEFLIDQRYTRPSELAVAGRGHGSVIAGAAMTRRPDLFAAVLLDAPLLDLTRFSRFAGGAAWVPEYGSPDVPDDLRSLLDYSPLQHVRAGGHYPATLVTVGGHDEVVTPVHAYKFVAALQAAQTGAAPVLLRADPDMGFGPGAADTRSAALDTDRLTFLVNALSMR